MAFGSHSLDMSLLEMRASDVDGERGAGPFEVTDPSIFFEAELGDWDHGPGEGVMLDDYDQRGRAGWNAICRYF